MFKKWRLTDRTRTLLTLELAIVLPAAGLLGFSIWNLKHIQHSEAVEAVIQRDLSHVLYIAEKKSYHKATDLITPVRKAFPGSDGDRAALQTGLEHILLEHPEFAYAIVYDKKRNLLVSRGQPARDDDPEFCAGEQEAVNSVSAWLPIEAPMLASRIRAMEEKDEDPVGFEGGWMLGENRHYWNLAYFIPPGISKDHVVLGMVSFDNEYLRKAFFPGMMKDVLTSKSGVLMEDANPAVMMIHPSKDPAPWVTSANWDGAKPEAERNFQWAFPDLTLAI
jgi:hypothetical protein